MTSTTKQNNNDKQLSQTSGSSSRSGVSTRNKSSAEGTTPLPHNIITKGAHGRPKGLKPPVQPQPSSNNNTARGDNNNQPTTSTPRRDDNNVVQHPPPPSEVLFKDVTSKSPNSRPPTQAERDAMQGKQSYAAAAASTPNTSSNNHYGVLDQDSSVASSNTGSRAPDNTDDTIIGRAGSIRDTTAGNVSGDNNIDTTINNTNTPPTNPNNTEGGIIPIMRMYLMIPLM